MNNTVLLSGQRRVLIHHGHRHCYRWWMVSAPYLTNERSHHMLQLLDAKDKAENLMDSFRNYFR